MEKKTILFMLLLVMCCFAVSAYTAAPSAAFNRWVNFANVMQDYYSNTGGTYPLFQSYTAFGSDRASSYTNLTNSSYGLCNMGSTTFPTFSEVVNINSEPFVMFWVITDNYAYIYDMDCDLIQIIDFGEDIVASPQYMTTNPYSDFDPVFLEYEDVVVTASNSTFFMYKWSETFNLYEQVMNYTLPISLSSMTCDEWGMINHCYLYEDNSKNITDFNLNTGVFTVRANVMATAPAFEIPIDYPMTYLNAGSEPLYARIVLCNAHTPSDACIVLDEDGNKVFNISVDKIGTATVNPIEYMAYAAKLGTNFRIFRSWNGNYNPGAPTAIGKAYISDINSNVNYLEITCGSYSTSSNYKFCSNWAVVDFDGDGDNDACILIGGTAAFINLTCYDSGFNKIYNQGFNDTMGGLSNIYIADFIPDSDYLALATAEGIFDLEDGSKWFNTGVSLDRLEFSPDGNIMGAGGGEPWYMFSSADGSTLVRLSNISVECGDGVCTAGFENELSCYTDCNNATAPESGGDGIGDFVGEGNSEDCNTRYEEGGYCRLAPEGHTCVFDDQCLSNSCSNGLCTKPTLILLLGAAKDDLVGDDDGSSSLLSLAFAVIIMMVVAMGLGSVMKSSPIPLIAGLVVFILSVTFFGFVGWIYPFIVIGLWFLVALIGLVIFLTQRG